jgi:hypothetical protein
VGDLEHFDCRAELLERDEASAALQMGNGIARKMSWAASRSVSQSASRPLPVHRAASNEDVPFELGSFIRWPGKTREPLRVRGALVG